MVCPPACLVIPCGSRVCPAIPCGSLCLASHLVWLCLLPRPTRTVQLLPVSGGRHTIPIKELAGAGKPSFARVYAGGKRIKWHAPDVMTVPGHKRCLPKCPVCGERPMLRKTMGTPGAPVRQLLLGDAVVFTKYRFSEVRAAGSPAPAPINHFALSCSQSNSILISSFKCLTGN